MKGTFDAFTYTVPANTGDFIYLNFDSVNKGMIVTWCCATAASVKRCDSTGSITINPAH